MTEGEEDDEVKSSLQKKVCSQVPLLPWVYVCVIDGLAS